MRDGPDDPAHPDSGPAIEGRHAEVPVADGGRFARRVRAAGPRRAQDGLHLKPGRLPPRLHLLRDGDPGLREEPDARRDRRAVSYDGTARPGRGVGAGDQQRRLHGDGGAIPLHASMF